QGDAEFAGFFGVGPGAADRHGAEVEFVGHGRGSYKGYMVTTLHGYSGVWVMRKCKTKCKRKVLFVFFGTGNYLELGEGIGSEIFHDGGEVFVREVFGAVEVEWHVSGGVV